MPILAGTKNSMRVGKFVEPSKYHLCPGKVVPDLFATRNTTREEFAVRAEGRSLVNEKVGSWDSLSRIAPTSAGTKRERDVAQDFGGLWALSLVLAFCGSPTL